MNSQQELLDAINAISKNKDRSFDTPATVLRVEGETAWVHIDGGADETPCLKTINCAEGETVQVRISNGNAFLVGNASAPPTDDKTANVAHFVAEQADVKATNAEETATEVKETVDVLEVEVDGKVDVGDSNIQHLSSTMYQNANGVNIFNDTLAVGDSYAHIDGDSFDIKEASSAGTIDDTNDATLATFGADGIVLGRTDEEGYRLEMSSSGFELVKVRPGPRYLKTGWAIDTGQFAYVYQGVYSNSVTAELKTDSLQLSSSSGSQYEFDWTKIERGKATFEISSFDNSDVTDTRTVIEAGTIKSEMGQNIIMINPPKTEITPGKIQITGNVQDFDGNNKTPTILESSSISASTTTYTFTDDAITADSVIDIYDTIFGFAPTAMSVSAGSATITFPAQSSSHNIKLFVY